MRLVPNIGSSRIYEELLSATSFEIAARSLSVHGLAIAAVITPLRRLLLSSAIPLQCSNFDRRRRNGLTLRSEARSALTWLADAEIRAFDRALAQSLILCGSPPHSALTGKCGLTTSGLGFARGDTVGMVNALDGSSAVGAVVEWFERLCNRPPPGYDQIFGLFHRPI